MIILKLVQCLPLSIIEHEKQYERMLAVMKQLAIKDNRMTKGERQYFEVLGLLVGQYEDKHFKKDYVAPPQMLRFIYG